MHPTEAVQTYLDGRTDLALSSKESHSYRLERFLEWCEEEEIDDMNDLTGRKVQNLAVPGGEQCHSQKPTRDSLCSRDSEHSARSTSEGRSEHHR